jgi:hypothetical protein
MAHRFLFGRSRARTDYQIARREKSNSERSGSALATCTESLHFGRLWALFGSKICT